MTFTHINSVPALLTREQAAKYLGVSVSALAAWACNKRYDLPMIRVGRLVKYRIQDLDNFISRNTIGGEAA
jgi:excisionase family DNA binding protein